MATQDDKIWPLERELEMAKKVAKENGVARKVGKEQAAKMHEDFKGYRR